MVVLFLWFLFFAYHCSLNSKTAAIGKRNNCTNIGVFQYLNLSHRSLHNMQAPHEPSGANAIYLRGARHHREARDEGKRKIKCLFAVHCSSCSAHLRQQILTTRDDVKRTNQNTIHYRAKLSPFWRKK